MKFQITGKSGLKAASILALSAVLSISQISQASPVSEWFGKLFSSMRKTNPEEKNVFRETLGPRENLGNVKVPDALPGIPKTIGPAIENITAKAAANVIPDTFSRPDVYGSLATCLNERPAKFCLVLGDSSFDIINAVRDIANRISREQGQQVPREMRSATVADLSIEKLISESVRDPVNPTINDQRDLLRNFQTVLKQLGTAAKSKNIIFSVSDYDVLISNRTSGLNPVLEQMREMLAEFQAQSKMPIIIGSRRSVHDRDLGVLLRDAKNIPEQTRAGFHSPTVPLSTVEIKAASPSEALEMLKVNRMNLIREMGIMALQGDNAETLLSDVVLQTAIRLTRSDVDGSLPGGAIEILRKAVAAKKFRGYRLPRKVTQLDLRISGLQDSITHLQNEAAPEGSFFKRRIQQLQNDLQAARVEREKAMSTHQLAAKYLDSLSRLVSQKSTAMQNVAKYKDGPKYAAEYERQVDPIDKQITWFRDRLKMISPDSSGVSQGLTESDVLASQAEIRGVSIESLRAIYGSIREQIPADFGEQLKKEWPGGPDYIIDIISKIMEGVRNGGYTRGLPIMKFMIFGPTGTGKTELISAIARILERHNEPIEAEITRTSGRPVPSNMLPIPGNEMTSEINLNAIVGPDPGYLGSDKSYPAERFISYGKPWILFVDEIEKSKGTFLANWLNGCLTKPGQIIYRPTGAKIRCDQVIVAIAGNAIQDEFQGAINEIAKLPTLEQRKAAARAMVPELKEYLMKNFAPTLFPDKSFLNRFVENVFVTSLHGTESLKKVAESFTDILRRQIDQSHFGLQITERAKARLAEAGDARTMADWFDQEIKTQVNSRIEEAQIQFNQSAHQLPHDPNQLVPGDDIVIDFDGNNFTFHPAPRS